MRSIIYSPFHDSFLAFSRPRNILYTRHLGDVPLIIDEIESLVNQNGWFAVGFLTYESSPAFDQALRVIPPPAESVTIPPCFFALFDRYSPVQLSDLRAAPLAPLTWTTSVEERKCRSHFKTLKDIITRGETYLAHYTHSLQAAFSQDPLSLFLHLAQTQRGKFGAYIDTPHFSVCSGSSQLFFLRDPDRVVTSPMKSPVENGFDEQSDLINRHWLMDSVSKREKDLIIENMMRNDLRKIAENGKIHVGWPYSDEPEQPTLRQATSTLWAQSTKKLSEILGALFPCGSITGAPKVKTMEIISRLEPRPRGIYTGTIGLVCPGDNAHFNVAIRTATVDKIQKQITCGSGGYIVRDCPHDA